MATVGTARRLWLAVKNVLSPVADNRGGWHPLVREPFSGAWQRNIEWSVDTVLAHPTVFACVTLIASDIAKMRTKLVEEIGTDLWVEIQSGAFSPVLRKPNRFQNQVQFKKNWMLSKLTSGNTYVLLERDDRMVVRRMFVLDPRRVKVLVAPEGSVFYQLDADNVSGIEEAVTVPASHIIHDRTNCLFHPLVGISPLFASGAAASVGLTIQSNAGSFFGKGSNPSGILTAPASISDPVAKRLKEEWNVNFSGQNSGKVAVLGDGLKFEAMRMTAVDAQMVEHDKAIDERICSAFRVPSFMVNVGPTPTYQNAEVLIRQYYSTCLQDHAVEFETAMDDGLNLVDETKGGKRYGIELDKDALLQMDTATMYKTLAEGVRGGFLAPNEARRKVDLVPLEGGDTVYLQHQDYPIDKLYNRLSPDAAEAPAPAAAQADDAEDDGDEDVARFFDIRARTLRLKAAA